MNENDSQPLEHLGHVGLSADAQGIGDFLRAMVQMVRPKKLLAIGTGYTTQFLNEGLINNKRVLDDGNLDREYIENYRHDPKLIIVDDAPIEVIKDHPGMMNVLTSNYVEIFEGNFQENSEELIQKYGEFDFVWFACNSSDEYKIFFQQYWDACSHYVICHFKFLNGEPIRELSFFLNKNRSKFFKIDIVEPDQRHPSNIAIIQKDISKL